MPEQQVIRHQTKRKPRWYFGGIAGCTAAAVTHPFDLIKVTLQTSQKYNPTLPQTIKRIIKKNNGNIFVFYSGVSATILRQITYTTTRFGIYELGRPYFKTDHFLGKVSLAALAGVIGGFVGTPTDVVNVRMQSDTKLSPRKRRNYKHALDGLIRIYRDEGIRGLYAGAVITSLRAICTTIGQIAFYEQFKTILMKTKRFHDNSITHLTASLIASISSTCLILPFDVIKTLTMDSKPPKNTIRIIIMKTYRLGPKAFYKGITPALVRNTPHTVILFMVFEQLRLHFGIDPAEPVLSSKKENE